MGQTLSAPTLANETDGWPSLLEAPPEGSPLPAQLPPYNTTIIDIGHLSDNGACTWHVQGGRLRYPIPNNGYKATCEINGQKLHLSVEPNGGNCQFKLQTETGDEIYTGATPTAPLAKWALSLGRLEIPNGLDAFGFSNPQVQAILRHLAAPTGKVDALVAQLEPGTAVAAWAKPETSNTATTPTSAAARPSLVEAIQREAQRIAHPHPTPSLAPSLHNWLSVGAPDTSPPPNARAPTNSKKRPATNPPSLPLPLSIPTATNEGTAATPTLMAATPFSSPQAQQQQAPGLPPRPSSRAPPPSSFAAPVSSPEAHAAVLVNRPASRSRSGAMSSGRGWTAFTAFGLQTRDSIKEANPYASATEIEKMVGRQWAALTPEGKQHYADVAAEVRRSSQGNLGAMGSAELRTEMAGAGFPIFPIAGAGGPDHENLQHQNAVLLLARTRSDAASPVEERQLRPSRRPKNFGPEYDTSDAPLPGRKGSVWESEIDKVYADILAVEEAERVAAERAAAKAAKEAKAAQRRGEKKVKEAEAEADALGVLADMRAEVLASESKEEIDEAEAAGSEKLMSKTNGQEAASAYPAGVNHHQLEKEEQ